VTDPGPGAVCFGKRALPVGIEEEGQAVATTKEKQQAPQLVYKNVPDPYFPGILSTKRGTTFCRICLNFRLCLYQLSWVLS
jgi:hypothetical protein